MGKRKNVIEKFINLIGKKYKSIEKDFDETFSLTNSLKLIDEVFTEEEQDDYDILKEVSTSSLQELVSLLIKEDEVDLKKGINAAHFLVVNGIELVDEQKEKLSELSYRANIKRRSLEKAIKRSKESFETLDIYKKLEDKLKKLTIEGFLDNETVDALFTSLNIKEEEQEEYLKEILKFNCERFKTLSSNMNKGDAIEMLVIEDDIDIIEPAMTIEQLKEVFEKHGYDIKILGEELENYLVLNGNLQNIDEVFESIKKNHIDFLSNDKKNAKMLTKFLLESSKELIDSGCKIFKSRHVDLDVLKNYKAIFFPPKGDGDVQLEIYQKKKKTLSKEKNLNDEDKAKGPLSDLAIDGKSEEFIKNLELFDSLGYDVKALLERNAKLITTYNKTILRHIEQLRLYEYPFGEPDFPLSAISSYRIMELTDGFIEVGEEAYIKKYASRLSAYTDGTLERIYALKKNGMPYKVSIGTEEKLNSYVTNHKLSCGLLDEQIDEIVPKEVDTILNGNKFNVLLDTYLPMTISTATLENPLIKQLDDKYMTNNCTYNVNGVLISRKKLLRNYEFLMNTDLIPEEEKDTEQIMLVSAIYKSKLNMEEIEKVNNGLNSCMKVGGNDEVLKK